MASFPPETLDVAVIGGGPAGLAAAETAAAQLGPEARIVVFEAKPSVGRKLLMAGKSGLNITNAEPWEAFVGRYRAKVPASAPALAPALAQALEAFPPSALRAWMAALGQDSFVGSSGRVFPAAMKASPLLRAWLARLGEGGVDVRTRWRWTGVDGARLAFDTPQGPASATARAVVLALGGASWPRLGADGAWTAALRRLGAEIEPFRPSNVGWELPWSARFRDRFAGAPLKTIALCAGERRVRGDLMIAGYGLEGGPIYHLTPDLLARPAATLDLAPDRELSALTEALQQPRGKQSFSNWMRKTARLDAVKTALLREAEAPAPSDAASMAPAPLARRIKALPLAFTGPRPLAEAISTAGGLAWPAVTDGLELVAWPGTFAAGEMLAWDAPTGGQLLTACLALGRRAGASAARRVERGRALTLGEAARPYSGVKRRSSPK